MTIALAFNYAPVLRHPAKSLARRGMRPSVLKLERIANDAFIKTKLPVPECAGSFCINTLLPDAIKELTKKEIYKLEFNLDHKEKTVSINGYPKLTKAINIFRKEIPDFFYIFRPKTDEPDLPHHVLSTFQQVLLHPEFKALSQRKQVILMYSALLHDVGKTLHSEPEHALISKKMIERRLHKTNLQKEDQDLILKLIKHHHYCYNVKSNIKSYKDYAKIFSEEEFKLLRILTESDLASKEVNFKNLRRMVENKTIFKQQANTYAKMQKEFVA